jgi:hypothetical protein
MMKIIFYVPVFSNTVMLASSGKPFMHVRMQENVEISNPMYLREEVDDDAEALDGNFALDTGKVGICWQVYEMRDYLQFILVIV